MRPKGKVEAMKKLLSVMAVAMLVCAASSWAASTNLLNQIDVKLRATLSTTNGTKVKVTETALEGSNALSVVELQIINGSSTNEERDIARNVVADTNNVLTSATILLTEQARVELRRGKFADVFQSSGVDSNISGAVWFLAGHFKETVKRGVTNDTITGNVEGVWKDDVSAFKGTLGAVKK